MVYDISKIFVNSIDRKFNKVKRYSTGPFALFTLDNLTILFIAFLEAQGNSKLKEFGKSFMVRTLGLFL